MTDPTQPPRGYGADNVILTALAKRIQRLTESVEELPILDRQKIEQLRHAIERGDYEINARAAADKLAEIEAVLAAKRINS